MIGVPNFDPCPDVLSGSMFFFGCFGSMINKNGVVSSKDVVLSCFIKILRDIWVTEN